MADGEEGEGEEGEGDEKEDVFGGSIPARDFFRCCGPSSLELFGAFLDPFITFYHAANMRKVSCPSLFKCFF